MLHKQIITVCNNFNFGAWQQRIKLLTGLEIGHGGCLDVNGVKLEHLCDGDPEVGRQPPYGRNALISGSKEAEAWESFEGIHKPRLGLSSQTDERLEVGGGTERLA